MRIHGTWYKFSASDYAKWDDSVETAVSAAAMEVNAIWFKLPMMAHEICIRHQPALLYENTAERVLDFLRSLSRWHPLGANGISYMIHKLFAAPR